MYYIFCSSKGQITRNSHKNKLYMLAPGGSLRNLAQSGREEREDERWRGNLTQMESCGETRGERKN